MIPELGIDIVATSYIKKAVVDMARPLTAAAALIAVQNRDRLQRTGRVERYRLRPYGRTTIRRRSKMGLQTRFKDLTETGNLMRSMRIKLTQPTRAIASFTKRSSSKRKSHYKQRTKRQTMTNAQLIRTLFHREPVSFFKPVTSQLRDIAEMFSDEVQVQALKQLGIEQKVFMRHRKRRNRGTPAQKRLEGDSGTKGGDSMRKGTGYAKSKKEKREPAKLPPNPERQMGEVIATYRTQSEELAAKRIEAGWFLVREDKLGFHLYADSLSKLGVRNEQ